MNLFRQGDVLVQQITALPPKSELQNIPNEDGAVVLAHGEVTGHKHQIFADPNICFLSREGTQDRYLEVGVTSDLRHEEHSSISLPPGTYRIAIQREYNGEISRAVEDLAKTKTPSRPRARGVS